MLLPDKNCIPLINLLEDVFLKISRLPKRWEFFFPVIPPLAPLVRP